MTDMIIDDDDPILAHNPPALARTTGALLERAARLAAERVEQLREDRDRHDADAKRQRDELNARLVDDRRRLNEAIAEAALEAERTDRALRAYTRTKAAR